MVAAVCCWLLRQPWVALGTNGPVWKLLWGPVGKLLWLLSLGTKLAAGVVHAVVSHALCELWIGLSDTGTLRATTRPEEPVHSTGLDSGYQARSATQCILHTTGAHSGLPGQMTPVHIAYYRRALRAARPDESVFVVGDVTSPSLTSPTTNTSAYQARSASAH